MNPTLVAKLHFGTSVCRTEVGGSGHEYGPDYRFTISLHSHPFDLTSPSSRNSTDVDWRSTNPYRFPMADSKTRFGRRLKTDRLRVGLTVRGLADRAKINYSYVTKLERAGKAIRVSSAIVASLANALGQNELEYLDLAGHVPAPFDKLLASREAREFLRAALQSKLTNNQWRKLKEQIEKQTPHKTKTSSVA